MTGSVAAALACAAGGALLAPGLNLAADRMPDRLAPAGRAPWRRFVLTVVVVAAYAAAGLRLRPSAPLPATLVLFAGLVVLGACDVERRLLPRLVVYPTAVAAAAALVAGSAATGAWGRLGVAGGCGAAAFALTWVVHALNSQWLGFGDVRLCGLIGLVLGWQGAGRVVLALVVADVAGIVVMGALIGLRRARRDTPFPFGVFLAVGAVVAALA